MAQAACPEMPPHSPCSAPRVCTVTLSAGILRSPRAQLLPPLWNVEVNTARPWRLCGLMQAEPPAPNLGIRALMLCAEPSPLAVLGSHPAHLTPL